MHPFLRRARVPLFAAWVAASLMLVAAAVAVETAPNDATGGESATELPPTSGATDYAGGNDACLQVERMLAHDGVNSASCDSTKGVDAVAKGRAR